MPKQGKTYLEARKKVNREAKYSLEEALELLKETAQAKFDETVEVREAGGVAFVAAKVPLKARDACIGLIDAQVGDAFLFNQLQQVAHTGRVHFDTDEILFRRCLCHLDQ